MWICLPDLRVHLLLPADRALFARSMRSAYVSACKKDPETTEMAKNFSPMDLDYIHVQESTSADDTIEAKRRFEQFAAERGVSVKHYHADNGIFASRGFREEVAKCGQRLTFCGVGAHHQNGVAERRIQDLSDSARAMLAHAAHRNPAVTAHLWPYAALKHASYTRRLMPRDKHSKSPEELFAKSSVRPTTKYLHAFGCPVHVLQGALQGGSSIPKWDARSRTGVYLGQSQQHASSVSLILNPQTGYISPQFHCVYDDRFDTPSRDKTFSQLRAEKAGLQEDRENEPTPVFDSRDYSKSRIPDRFHEPFDSLPVAEEEPPQPQHEPVSRRLRFVDELEQQENEGADDQQQHQQQADPDPEPAPPAPDPDPEPRSGRAIRRTRRLEESSLLPTLRSFVAIIAHVTMALARLEDF
eukprot:scaffold499_cov120-Cylindrotheca_fusiformis.AAC.2